MLDRVIGYWLQRLKVRHGLNSATAIADSMWDERQGERVFLHVGCGHSRKEHTVSGFMGDDWREIRLDADASVQPDIVGTMTNMSAVPDGRADAIYSSHGLEHLYWHDVPHALAEFHRTLTDDGFAIVTCPDLQAAAKMIAEDRLFDTAYESPAGPITPFDILYSYRPFVQANPEWMSHHCGFTLSTLTKLLKDAGFASVYGLRREWGFDLWLLAHKSELDDDVLMRLAAEFLPAPG